MPILLNAARDQCMPNNGTIAVTTQSLNKTKKVKLKKKTKKLCPFYK